jgi:L-threonylcarbamoyladenylate synthase
MTGEGGLIFLIKKMIFMKEVSLEQAVEVLKKGELLIYPTETVYGLGADISQEAAIQKIFNLKGRSKTQPISIFISSIKTLSSLVTEITPTAQVLIKKFWPGPLTLVLPASAKVSSLLHGGSGWIGVRMSSHPLAQKLVQQLGSPITTTSANPSGEASGIQVEQIKKYFDHERVFILSEADLKNSRGSTVVKVEGDQLQLLRQGDIPFLEIEEATK